MRSWLMRVFAAALFAAPWPAVALPCVSGTLADYLLLASCEIGATTFSDFEELLPLPTDATPIAAADTSVTPVASASDVGLAFGLPTSAGAGDLFSSLFGFRVTAGVGAPLSAVRETLEGGSASGDGVAIFLSDLCADGTFAVPPAGCLGTPSALTTFVDPFGSDVDESVPLPATFIAVVANFIVDGGPSGTAALTGGTLRFATSAAPPTPTVDEPGVLALALAGLAAWLARRRPRRAAR